MTVSPASFLSWVRATWIGWLLGIPLIIAFALFAELIGLGGAQVFVGAGMGTGVGFCQARLLSAARRPWSWTLASALGLALPFLLFDIAQALGRAPPYNLQAAVALGGLAVGACQAWVFRARLVRPLLWIPTSVAGWALAGLPTAAADRLFRAHAIRGLGGALVYLGLIGLGGLLLGLVTGAPLKNLLRPAGNGAT